MIVVKTTLGKVTFQGRTVKLQVGGHPWISENHLLLRKDEQLLENITIYGKLSFDDSHLEIPKRPWYILV